MFNSMQSGNITNELDYKLEKNLEEEFNNG